MSGTLNSCYVLRHTTAGNNPNRNGNRSLHHNTDADRIAQATHPQCSSTYFGCPAGNTLHPADPQFRLSAGVPSDHCQPKNGGLDASRQPPIHQPALLPFTSRSRDDSMSVAVAFSDMRTLCGPPQHQHTHRHTPWVRGPYQHGTCSATTQRPILDHVPIAPPIPAGLTGGGPQDTLRCTLSLHWTSSWPRPVP